MTQRKSTVGKRQAENKGKKKKPSRLQPFRRTGKRIKRNAPCSCGSGKKAKNCCLPRIKMWESIPPEKRGEFIAKVILQQPVVELSPVNDAVTNEMLNQDGFQSSVDAAMETMKQGIEE